MTRLDDELDAPLTLAEIEEDERIQQEIHAPLVVAWDDLDDRQRRWLERQWEQEGG